MLRGKPGRLPEAYARIQPAPIEGLTVSDYEFIQTWRVRGSAGRVYDVIADIGGYPTWWPQVRSIAKVDESTARIVIRSFLPYSLECEIESVVQDRAAGILEARLNGDIDGWSRWTLTQDGDLTVMLFEQVVDTPNWPLRAARWVHWLPELNHAWMMKRGEIALRRHLAHIAAN